MMIMVIIIIIINYSYIFLQVWNTTVYIIALHVSAALGHLQRQRRCY
jgi:hypothetical protein